jgi:hypothetical protein
MESRYLMFLNYGCNRLKLLHPSAFLLEQGSIILGEDHRTFA